MFTSTVSITAGDHDPPHPFVVVDRHGLHVDLSKIHGDLWNDKTIAEVTWGHRAIDGRLFGYVKFKNGDPARVYGTRI